MSCSKPCLLSNALHLNNQAADLVGEGEYEEAISTLSAALMQLKRAIRSPPPTSGASSNTSARPLKRGGMLHFLVQDSTTKAKTTNNKDLLKNVLSPSSIHNQDRRLALVEEQESAEVEDQDEDLYFYRYPIQVNENMAELDSTDIVELVSFAGIYNLGLCHHLQAMLPAAPMIKQRQDSSITTTRQMLLRRATAFYEHAQRLLADNQVNFDPELIHTLVIANNLGHAHYFLGNHDAGKLCFQRLLSAIIYISENVGSSDENVIKSDKKRWDGFMVNIMQHLIGEISHAAAA